MTDNAIDQLLDTVTRIETYADQTSGPVKAMTSDRGMVTALRLLVASDNVEVSYAEHVPTGKLLLLGEPNRGGE